MSTNGRVDLPAAVRRFLDRHVDRIEQLEVLLFLHHKSSHYWSAAHVARGLRVSAVPVAVHLESLAQRGFLDVRLAADMTYRFHPLSPALALDVAAVAAVYTDHRDALVAFLRTRRRPLNGSSDAYRFGPDRDER